MSPAEHRVEDVNEEPPGGAPTDPAASAALPSAPSDAVSAPAGAAPAGAAPAPATGTPPKTRIALWDNARFVLILLVVVGHMISTVRTDSQLGFALYAYIYLFHMPAMILLAGVFARPETSPKVMRSTVQLLLTWLVWEGIWAVIKFLQNGQEPGPGFLIRPSWTLWFLVTLVTMRLLLPLIARLRHPLLVSSVIALGGSLIPDVNTEFSASRTMAFLPFFVLGWLARDRGWLERAWFTAPRVMLRGAAWAFFAMIALVFALISNFDDIWRIDHWLTWRDSYYDDFESAPIGELQPDTWVTIAPLGIVISAVLLCIAALMTFALLIVLPRRRTFYTTWGTRTLFVYLLHGPIVYLLREHGIIDDVQAWGLFGVPALVLAGIGLTMVLSMKWVTVVFRPIIEPRVDWLLKRE